MISDERLHDIAVRQMHAIAGELKLPKTNNMSALLDQVDADALMKTVEYHVSQAIGPVVTRTLLDAQGIPHVTAHVELEFWDTAFDICHLVEEHDFDCTAALEFMTADMDEDDLLSFLGFVEEDGSFDSDGPEPEDMDAIFRIAETYGAVPDWDGPFSCYIASGWDAWAENRLDRMRAAAKDGE